MSEREQKPTIVATHYFQIDVYVATRITPHGHEVIYFKLDEHGSAIPVAPVHASASTTVHISDPF